MTQDMNPPSRTTGENLRRRQLGSVMNQRLNQSDAETHAAIKENGIPLVDAMAFAQSTHQYGGASMDVHSGKVYTYGARRGTAIGGELDTEGKPIETHYLRPNEENPGISLAEVSEQRERVKQSVGRRKEMLLGSWVPEPHKIAAAAEEGKDIRGVNMDASGFYTRKQAKKVYKKRTNEVSGVKMKSFADDPNPYFGSTDGKRTKKPKK